MCFPAEPQIRIPDVARWLSELSETGAIVMRDSDRGWYVQIAERLWYRKEDFGEKQPKWGPREPTPPAQGSLPLGPLSSVERAHVPRGQVATRAQTNTEPKSKPNPRGPRGTRAAWPQKDSGIRPPGTFAADETAFAGDSAWEDVVRELGADEMAACGALWVSRWKLARAELGAAHRDWRALTPEQRAGGNFAAYLTAAFTRLTERRSA